MTTHVPEGARGRALVKVVLDAIETGVGRKSWLASGRAQEVERNVGFWHEEVLFSEGDLRPHVARPEHKWFFLVWIACSAELWGGGYASISATLSLRHCNVIFTTWQCDICDIVMSNYHIAMSYFSLNKWYTSLKSFTRACQNSHGYVKI
jgi:hypothetical protein